MGQRAFEKVRAWGEAGAFAARPGFEISPPRVGSGLGADMRRGRFGRTSGIVGGADGD